VKQTLLLLECSAGGFTCKGRIICCDHDPGTFIIQKASEVGKIWVRQIERALKQRLR